MITILTTPTRVEIMLRAGKPLPTADLAAHRAWALASPNSPAAPSPFAARRWSQTPRRPEPCSRSRCGCTRAPTVPTTRPARGWSTGSSCAADQSPGACSKPAACRRGGVCPTRLRRVGGTGPRRVAGCRREHRRTGHGTGSPSLTPQELQIVRLVSEGLSNRQVAEQMFLSPRTVEYHLYKVYPKLGIGSRTELIRRRASSWPGRPPADQRSDRAVDPLQYRPQWIYRCPSP